jgi:hypothetical protein
VPVAVAAAGAIFAAGGHRTVKGISVEMLKLAWAVMGGVVLWFPWMFVLVNQMREVAGGYWIQPVTVGGVLYGLHMVIWSFTHTESLQAHQALLTLSVLIIAAWRSRVHRGAVWCVVVVAISLGVPVAVSLLWKPILLFRALMPLGLPLCILFGFTFTHGLTVQRRWLVALLAGPVLALGVLLYYINLPALKSDVQIRDYVDYRPGDVIYHINDGSMVVSHAYTPPEWVQYELPATGWDNIGDMSTATRQALGIEAAALDSFNWRRAWLIHGATPMTAPEEDAAVAALLAEYPHQLIFESKDSMTRLVIYLLWNKRVAKG